MILSAEKRSLYRMLVGAHCFPQNLKKIPTFYTQLFILTFSYSLVYTLQIESSHSGTIGFRYPFYLPRALHPSPNIDFSRSSSKGHLGYI